MPTHAISGRLSVLGRALLSCWLMVFILVSSAEASHFCGTFVFHSWHHGSGSVEQAVPGEGSTCLICVASQSATVFAAASQSMPGFVLSEAFSLEDFSLPHAEGEVSLYSRPPPIQ